MKINGINKTDNINDVIKYIYYNDIDIPKYNLIFNKFDINDTKVNILIKLI